MDDIFDTVHELGQELYGSFIRLNVELLARDLNRENEINLFLVYLVLNELV
jgi:hypothetical protein